MNLVILGSVGKQPFPPGWKKETVVALLGGGEIDLTASPAAEGGARLTAVAVLGSLDVRLPAGSRVSLSGVSFLGNREATVEPGEGAEISVRAVAVLGSVKVNASSGAQATPP